MTNQKCEACQTNGLNNSYEAASAPYEVWTCDNCHVRVVVPVLIKRFWDYVDWSCADDKQKQGGNK